ncbi:MULTISPECIES: SDR family NAD(P)-dependent oxidoreductase [Rhodobacterales]|uniref:SDR family NAD(P)-dependent oxidoreductase n=1 Tax=Rhodobacterales TaxID=204455 RepID=UPI000C8F8A0C|nr:SDR family oxidoreductase [Heliomarina baculiformis]MAM24178.1 3-oxoacyl-ACP reductase [Paracoccaceae bacterium]HCQ56761.1 3-oxoacyl-ACP reductase [Sulfitobacter sp.]
MINPMALDNQVVIVTGAGQGIGRGVAALAAELGAKVVVNDLNEDGVKETAEQIGGNARAIVGNVAAPDFPGKLVKFALDEFGDINGLVNNAGIVRAAMIHKMDRATWQQVIDVNLTGVFACLQAVGTYYKDQTEKDPESAARRAIVNISSDAGRRGTIGQINYGAAKSGVLGLTMSAAREWGRYRINVNSVCFGMVETPMTETIRSDKFVDKYMAQIPMGRMSTPEEVAQPVCFLLSNAASYITGQHLSVNGGFHIGF